MNNSESKKTNTSQNNIEQNKQKSTDNTAEESKLHQEIDIDADGNKILVDRAREAGESTETLPNEIEADDPNAKRGVKTDKEAMKTVENEDRNSDITPNRYPNSHPDNHQDRGNQ